MSTIFKDWSNKAYLIAKIFGLLILGYVVWLMGLTRLAPFSTATLITLLIAMAVASWVKLGRNVKVKWTSIVSDELVFIFVFGLWTWVKGHAPDINGLEKFMDYGFTQSILNGTYFPPKDMWFSGFGINYYYFGHLMLAIVTKLSGVSLAVGFNLILSTLCALTFSMSYAIGRETISTTKKSLLVFGSLFIAVLITFSGNLQTVYAFTKGYQTEDPPPFWKIMSKLDNFENIKEGWNGYWYPNATRFIPYTIHEFPSYSFVVSDIHGHVLAIPIALLLIALVVEVWKRSNSTKVQLLSVVYGFIAGTAMMTNALDGPIYLGLWIAVWVAISVDKREKIISNLWPVLITTGVFLLTITPFLYSFKPFVSGIGVNCPPKILMNKNFGPLVFENSEKCQKSPVWMMLLLWGFFVYWATVMYLKVPNKDHYKSLGVCISLFSLALIIFPEFFYFKDIYPLHFRSNTMFKLGYQVFIMMSFVSGWTIVYLVNNRKTVKGSALFLVLGVPLVALILIYPYFSVKSYFGSLKTYKGLYGLNWMREEHFDNWNTINWINKQTNVLKNSIILEAQGDSYQDAVTRKPYNQISTFTGVPTIAGWYVHEWLWRGQSQIAKRAEVVRRIYETNDSDYAYELLKEYGVGYVLVGEMEREKYLSLDEVKFPRIGELVFSTGDTRLYKIN